MSGERVEEKKKALVQETEGPSKFKMFYVNLFTGILVGILINYPPFNQSMLAAFLLLLCIILLNFGISYTSAIAIALFTPTFVFAIYGWPTGRAFIMFGFFVAGLLILKGIYGLFKALGTGVGAKMEEAKPTPPSGELWGEAAEEIGKKTGEMVSKGGYVTAGGGRGLAKRTSNSFDELVRKFRELMQH